MLPDEAVLRVQRLLRFLNAERQITYKALANEIQIDVNWLYRISPSRSVATYEKLRAYCQKNNISADENSYSEEEFGLKYIIDALDISQEIVLSSVRRFSGKYLLFSLLQNERIAVTWFQFFDVSKIITLPVFKARRIGRDGHTIIYKGFYYEYMSSLFVIGNIEGTPLTRSLVLVPIATPRSRDRQGVMSGASTNDALFVSPCYLKRLDDKSTWPNYENFLGEQQAETVQNKYDDVVSNLFARANVSTSVLRSGDG